MSHILQLFLKIIHRRIFGICEEQIATTQFEFRGAVMAKRPSIVSKFCFSDVEILTVICVHVFGLPEGF